MRKFSYRPELVVCQFSAQKITVPSDVKNEGLPSECNKMSYAYDSRRFKDAMRQAT